jgi:hypothetical protein
MPALAAARENECMQIMAVKDIRQIAACRHLPVTRTRLPASVSTGPAGAAAIGEVLKPE